MFLTGSDQVSREPIARVLDIIEAVHPDGDVAAGLTDEVRERKVYAACMFAHARRRVIMYLQDCVNGGESDLAPLFPQQSAGTTATISLANPRH